MLTTRQEITELLNMPHSTAAEKANVLLKLKRLQLTPEDKAYFFDQIVSGKMGWGVADIATDAEMAALLTAANVGKTYKFTGTTGTYVNGDLYTVEESE